ncbi:1-deoxy-D-xylulose-5-phosphate reductoisomerase [Isoptericola sp. S6320L]|uniref:1-deoxy-D-xylulose-5-phosphate reductoisomerase n=1 Tax=Isoptericola sp. S6320L TaxID=2926411 RepID=UPI001FF3A65F|nr:1-deoxy-D-xylulose-5-phosphate reductoisomerase [Isoptericola sp. S6320L]MCK0117058.1 1-deoxy-D-xylulose-5-phosphate reductoisomerase [Isoptericola sp. S6320L]
MSSPRTVTLLGSTGSIGTQAIAVVTAHPDRFVVEAISAGGSDVGLLAEQAEALAVRTVAVADPARADDLRAALATRLGSRADDVEVLAGPQAATEVAGRGADVVLNGITGSVGLRPTLAALEAGSTLALANKESLVVGGPLVKALAAPDQIVPVDSEHSAIAQALRGGAHSPARSEVRRLILTASGGPFRGRTRDEIEAVTAEQALAHPTWAMGPVVTVNSASLMNKGLELIEAHLLFDVPTDDITVVVHPQSVVHSMVEFCDGSTIAQASPPDMRLPIALGLSWPDRLDVVSPPCDWSQATTWTFEPLDDATFPAVGLARAAAAASGTHPAVYNAANEQGVAAFLSGRVGFCDIVDTVERVLGEHEGVAPGEVTLETVEAVEGWARGRADELLARS